MANLLINNERENSETLPGSVFISYARVDLQRVTPFADFLTNQNFRVFWDQNIEAGQLFREAIQKGLSEAACVLVIWTAASVKSKFVWDEIDNAYQDGYLVGVLLDAGIKPPIGFGQRQYIDLSWWDGKDLSILQQLVKPITSLARQGPNHFSYGYTIRNADGSINDSGNIVSNMRMLTSQVRNLGDLLTPGSTASADLRTTLDEINKTYKAVNASIKLFIKPAFEKADIDISPYLTLERIDLKNEIHEARGSCGLITACYTRYKGLRDYIKEQKPEMLEEADKTFGSLSSADDDLFMPLEYIGDLLRNESRVIANFLAAGQNEAARERIKQGRVKLAPLEDQLLTAIQELEEVQSSLGYKPPA